MAADFSQATQVKFDDVYRAKSQGPSPAPVAVDPNRKLKLDAQAAANLRPTIPDLVPSAYAGPGPTDPDVNGVKRVPPVDFRDAVASIYNNMVGRPAQSALSALPDYNAASGANLVAGTQPAAPDPFAYRGAAPTPVAPVPPTPTSTTSTTPMATPAPAPAPAPALPSAPLSTPAPSASQGMPAPRALSGGVMSTPGVAGFMQQINNIRALSAQDGPSYAILGGDRLDQQAAADARGKQLRDFQEAIMRAPKRSQRQALTSLFAQYMQGDTSMSVADQNNAARLQEAQMGVEARAADAAGQRAVTARGQDLTAAYQNSLLASQEADRVARLQDSDAGRLSAESIAAANRAAQVQAAALNNTTRLQEMREANRTRRDISEADIAERRRAADVAARMPRMMPNGMILVPQLDAKGNPVGFVTTMPKMGQ